MSKPQLRNKNFFDQVYKVVRTIPEGKVATYGQLAETLNTKDARKVGWALHANRDSEVPCHRVVNKDGKLADNFSFNGWQEQKARLLQEDISFISEKNVDLRKHLWKPKTF